MPTSKIIEMDKQSIIVDALLNNNKKVINELYANNYPKIKSMILKNNGNEQDAKDIYQEAFVALWRTVREKSFQARNETAVQGYLYTIAKNKWMDHLRSASYKKNISYDAIVETGFETAIEEHSDLDELKENKLAKALNAYKSLGEDCRNLLKKFYYEKKSMNEIADELLLDAASTRNKKYRCMQKLREITTSID